MHRWCKSITLVVFLTWFHFSLKEDYYNDHFKLVKIGSFPNAAITNRGSFITNMAQFCYYKSRQLSLQIGAALIITHPDRAITNQINYKLLQFGKDLPQIRKAIANRSNC